MDTGTIVTLFKFKRWADKIRKPYKQYRGSILPQMLKSTI